MPVFDNPYVLLVTDTKLSSNQELRLVISECWLTRRLKNVNFASELGSTNRARGFLYVIINCLKKILVLKGLSIKVYRYASNPIDHIEGDP